MERDGKELARCFFFLPFFSVLVPYTRIVGVLATGFGGELASLDFF